MWNPGCGTNFRNRRSHAEKLWKRALLNPGDVSIVGILVTILGLLLGLGISLLVGSLNPGFEPSMEMEARGAPNLLDFGVAILSGFVAAYALGRPGVANTLAGVAIAAALVPPLCVVGIGLTNGESDLALNSAILLPA